MDYSIITKYFPQLTALQQEQFAALGPCYHYWNARINVISRKDIDQLYLHHVLHALAIAKVISFPCGAHVWDVGTGGGFPGIPLAIFFPDVHFFLCDSIAKKIGVVNEVVSIIGLKNVTAVQSRAEAIDQTFDYAVSRAVTKLNQFVPLVWNKIRYGIFYQAGGDLEEEIRSCINTLGIERNLVKEYNISQWFEETFFEGKKVVSLKKNATFAARY